MLTILKGCAVLRGLFWETNVTKLEPIEDLIYDTLRQGIIFAEAWENAAIETTGTMRRFWPELNARLKKLRLSE